MIRIQINNIRKKLGTRKSFTQHEFLSALKALYPDTNVNTLKWKIFDLKDKGIIHSISRGVYTFSTPPEPYIPEISRDIKEIYQQIHNELPYTKLSIAHTGWFNEFMVHQVFRTWWIIEVEKDALRAVFNRLSEGKYKVFLDPSQEVFENYIADAEEAIILKPLISESPLQEIENIQVPSLEKFLIDCISDRIIYGSQYEEVQGIFESAVRKYSINLSRLRRYAARRSKLEEAEDLLKMK